jgi:hypothetical protein
MTSLSVEATAGRAVLPAQVRGRTGRLREDGAIVFGRHEPPEIALYGPYWPLGAGHYCLDFVCTDIDAPDDTTVFLGVEVLVDNRLCLAVADYCRVDLRDGRGRLRFEVPSALALGSTTPGQVEFRFLTYGRGAFVLTTAELAACPEGFAASDGPLKWRLSARAHARAWPLAQAADGGRWRLGRRVGFKPELRLPKGRYRLSFAVERGRVAGRTVQVAVSLGGRVQARQRFDLPQARTECALAFDVPAAHAFDHGAADDLDLWFSGLSPRRATDIELVRIGDIDDSAQAPAIVGDPRTRIVVIGNCQAELLTVGFSRLWRPRGLSAKYHFVGLPERFHASGRADLAEADIVLIQDISDFEHYPLKAEIPDRAETHRFPMLRHSTPWPFDSHNGLPDRVAEARETSEPFFLNFDGVLGRLRREVADPADRFDRYRRLDIDWLPNVERLARFEERRLLAQDRTFGIAIGAYILENYKKRPVFHSIAHPTDALFRELLRHLASLAGHRRAWLPLRSMSGLGNVEVPVHPVVARKVGIDWATETRLYNFRTQRVTWADYTRRYIERFG